MDNYQFISAMSIIAPLFVGVVFIRTLLISCRLLFLLIITVAIIELLAIILAKYGINNLFLFHLYSFIEFGVISMIYYQLIRNTQQRKFILYFLVVFQGFSLLNLLFFEKITGFNSFQRNIEAIILMFYFFFYLFEISKLKHEYSLRNPFFILTFGFIIYFVGTLSLFVYANQIIQGTDNSYWLIHSVLNIFLNGIYTIALWKGRIRMEK